MCFSYFFFLPFLTLFWCYLILFSLCPLNIFQSLTIFSTSNHFFYLKEFLSPVELFVEAFLKARFKMLKKKNKTSKKAAKLECLQTFLIMRHRKLSEFLSSSSRNFFSFFLFEDCFICKCEAMIWNSHFSQKIWICKWALLMHKLNILKK